MSPDDQFANRPGAVLCLRRQHARKYWLWYQIRSRVLSAKLTAEADQNLRHSCCDLSCSSWNEILDVDDTTCSAKAVVFRSSPLYVCVCGMIIQLAGSLW